MELSGLAASMDLGRIFYNSQMVFGTVVDIDVSTNK